MRSERRHRLSFQVGICALVHPEKSKGEDAYFVSDESRAFGLADGVSQWKMLNIDPSAYSLRMMNESKRLIDQKGLRDTRTILRRAFEECQIDTLGSCTVVLFALDEYDTVWSSSIGDSGFRVIRQGKIVYRSLPQQHEPNQPFQLGKSCE
jgi:protein phosphatase PTC7